MTVREVLRMGHPGLRERARPVENFGTPELRALVEDMTQTMKAKDGAGLAAPQIGVSQRVVIFGVDHNPRYPDAPPIPFTILVNPKLVMLSREVEEDWEGCLSVPGMRGMVPRYVKLRYTGFDHEGNPIDLTLPDRNADAEPAVASDPTPETDTSHPEPPDSLDSVQEEPQA